MVAVGDALAEQTRVQAGVSWMGGRVSSCAVKKRVAGLGLVRQPPAS